MNDTLKQRWSRGKELRGKEICELKPITLGGSATDPANKIALSREEHIAIVRYWNALIARQRREREEL